MRLCKLFLAEAEIAISPLSFTSIKIALVADDDDDDDDDDGKAPNSFPDMSEKEE